MGRALNNQLDKELPYGQANVRLNGICSSKGNKNRSPTRLDPRANTLQYIYK